MKKLYFLNEEEKNRILNLHENATKRQYLSEQQKPTQAELDKREARWDSDLKCVKSHKDAVPTVRADKTTMYKIGNTVYFNTGRKVVGGQKTPVPYTCNDPEFKSGVSTEDKTKKAQQYKQQVVTKTSDTTKQIQALLGLEKTGNMDSALLQKINDKLNGKPQEAPKSDVNTQPRPQVEPLQTSLKPTGVVQQQLTTQNPEQLTAGLQQMQQKAAATAAGLKQ
jgi:hypothetical protein